MLILSTLKELTWCISDAECLWKVHPGESALVDTEGPAEGSGEDPDHDSAGQQENGAGLLQDQAHGCGQ